MNPFYPPKFLKIMKIVKMCKKLINFILHVMMDVLYCIKVVFRKVLHIDRCTDHVLKQGIILSFSGLSSI